MLFTFICAQAMNQLRSNSHVSVTCTPNGKNIHADMKSQRCCDTCRCLGMEEIVAEESELSHVKPMLNLALCIGSVAICNAICNAIVLVMFLIGCCINRWYLLVFVTGYGLAQALQAGFFLETRTKEWADLHRPRDRALACSLHDIAHKSSSKRAYVSGAVQESLVDNRPSHACCVADSLYWQHQQP